MFLPELGEMIFCAGIVFEKESWNRFQVIHTKLCGSLLPQAIRGIAGRPAKNGYQ
jgi:hypothetical protein